MALDATKVVPSMFIEKPSSSLWPPFSRHCAPPMTSRRSKKSTIETMGKMLPNRGAISFSQSSSIWTKSSTIRKKTTFSRLCFKCQHNNFDMVLLHHEVEVQYPDSQITENHRATLLEFWKTLNGKTTSGVWGCAFGKTKAELLWGA